MVYHNFCLLWFLQSDLVQVADLVLLHLSLLSKPTRPLFHRRIFEIHDAIGGRATDEFSSESAPDIVLLNRPKRSRNETPQPSSIARRVSIAYDNSRAENRQTFEADTLNRFFF